MATPTLTVDIWSDLVCPWCHIGKRRFDTALAAFEHRDSVRVRWRSFELDPHGSAEPGLTLPERHLRDVGGTPEQARQRLQRVTDLAAESGLTYRLDLARPVNSFDAHRVMHYADQAGHGEPVREALMRAYTAEGAILSDAETLIRIAVENGLDEAGTRTMLKTGAFTDEVRADETLARQLGVTGVPTFVFANRYAVSGAQPVELFARLLTESWQETH
ncbi:putative DsbA family dithiol-disulfide isomerase [Thermocatellispora tengchongensis]|uniref:Putative DsbA family dithiol-disulfide isomerase n=1 Tax=Thermocatellispora tengchongensis TaxID=1073253 RepID=A0A840NWU9_9ACTN|nr:DsbA family oxidoreductase [Thermocatellispora tengchongensis]MBB5133314.1 putative DsbA family dithiol-disulfide isomerase [Thermocatellispora tengchongensis]